MIAQVLEATNLYKAARQVMRNKGASGIDSMSHQKLPEYIRENRSELLLSICNNSYVPQAILGVTIPKGNGKTRLLGIPTVVDRWLQQGVNQQLMTKFEYEFETFSYGFRPQKNIQKAVLQAQRYINDGYQDIVDIDLKGFFDEVDHCILLQLIYNKVQCRTTLRLIRKWLRVPISINGKLYKRRKGIPQGSPISPLLSNIILDVLDKEMQKQGVRYVRYADDFSMYAKSKSEAKRIGNSMYLFLRDKLKLPINGAKSGIRRPVNFKLLGHGFVPIYKKGIKGQYQLVVKQESWEKFKRNLKSLTKKTKPMSLLERLERLNQVCRGWMNNYRLTNIYAKLKKLDEWLRNRLRYCIWHDWKKLERKRKSLIRLGIENGQAYAWSRTRMGGWAVAQSPILKTTITLSILKRKGYKPMVDYINKKQTSIW
ncbi:group II intron reverse transcriptase/maturase [Polaribacter filamentus]|jgi:RNA-directed DNA polymerase|uniref:RNA-directed DNA polymerase n=1 Tax=Polaribacter filamentus TaxID=53483 RepID=A0A2S7KL37_9FLAO|nr:group II intron reverse transcriptase/maturase [Polaribacter filamentus]PQB03339.1 group II intron reverse transcriptase/maturase [Polaribacter filamentus]PQB06419.1 group II intron reverse transcriptase/maturase [Polaribacter filamentus]PQB06422.1 group II intron reverse transcriptase/maturase [Polaribacter filamentus]PQB06788.1 group II intron reverse transcriptase/maturase [Polaribacter filamentus]PQB06801.1 group II intron reverse transcriptase/maturase [Polaribacter filamentus]